MITTKRKNCIDCRGSTSKKNNSVRCRPCYTKTMSGPTSPRWNGGLATRLCLRCHEPFTTRYEQKYCSQLCFGLDYRGSKNHRYKGNLAKRRLQAMIRSMPEYILWRESIFRRDNWTCQECKTRGCFLHPHHIIALAKIIKDNNILTVEDARKFPIMFAIKNGVSLCIGCHKKIDSFMGKYFKINKK